jgi:hypothetical protein
MKLFILSVTLLVVTVTNCLQAATYYVSSLGKDSNSGTSTTSPWATIAKVNRTTFLPGDIIRFEGGKTFQGGIYFGASTMGAYAKVKGTAEKPIVFSSYGTGRATISSGSTYGFRGYNTAGFKIQNLIFKGPGRTQTSKVGIDFYTDVPNTVIPYIYISNVEVYGYKEAGIVFGSWDALTAGFGNVTIENSKVHDNGDVGISSYAQGRLVHKNFTLRNNKVYNTSGIPERTTSHSGSGISLGDVDGGLIEYCEAYNNGWLNASTSNGPAGIWGYRCNKLIIQKNESHHNKTGTTKDGGGFDLDGGCTNSIMQYNYSHNNDGAGFLLAQYTNAPVMKGLIVRYNISENDGRKNDYGGIHLWSSGSNGGVQDAQIYNNTVYMTASASGTPKAVMVRSGGFKNTRIRNNIFQTTGGAEIVRLNTTSDVRFEGNDYWSTGATFRIIWAGKTYSSLTAWRTATGQEKSSGVAVGYSLDPALTDPGKGVTIGNPKLLYNLTGYKLKSSSGLIGKGLNLNKMFGLNVGKQDFFGNNITLMTSFSIGGHQPGSSSATAAFTSSSKIEDSNSKAELSVYPNPVIGTASIKFSSTKEEAFAVTIYDLRGIVVHQLIEDIALPGNQYLYDFNTDNLPAGIYILKLITSSEQRSEKIVVTK